MKTTKLFVAAAIGTVSTVCLVQAQDYTTTADVPSPTAGFYRAQELSLDLFGEGSIGQQTIDHISGSRVEHHGRLGAGGGLNYFFTRYVGVGGDAYTENTSHNFIDSASGSLIGRLPIADTGIAPYVFGGGGYQFDEVGQSFAQCGGGIEFRFAKYAGFFVDARYVIADKTDNYGVGRAGLRVVF